MRSLWAVSSRNLLSIGLALGVSGVQANDDPSDSTATQAASALATTMTYDGAAIADATGGLRRSSTCIGNLHWRSLVDLEQAFGWSDSRFFADVLWVHGGNPDAFVGDAMGVSNIAAPPGVQIEELWIERNVPAADLSFLIGLYDLNSEFYRVESGGLFLDSSFGIGPELGESGIEGPSIFPRTSVGARFGWKPADDVVVRAALLDGVPLIRSDGAYRVFQSDDGLLAVTELALLARPADGSQGDRRSRLGRNSMLPPYDGKLAFGAWHYTTTLDRLDGAADPTQHGTSGAYLVGDRILARDPPNPNRNLSLFVQLGVADDRVNRFGTYFGGGLVAAGPFRARPNDEMGFAVAIARNGSAYHDRQASLAPTSRAETALELSYLIQATSWLAVQPDLQYVIHPDTDPTIPNALVFTLRFEVAKQF
jgi:porin